MLELDGRLLNRTWLLLLLCFIPTILATVYVAYDLRPSGPALNSDAPSGPDDSIRRVEAQSMLPGGKPAAEGEIAALVRYDRDAEDLPTGAVVFIFARNVSGGMPIAVERFRPSELPVEVLFRAPDDTGEPVHVVARLSLSGDVRLQQGDVEVVSEAIVPGRDEIHIELLIPAP
jgi:hypothetical protein